MSRFKKSEYRAERRGSLVPTRQQTERCEGLMGTCDSTAVEICVRCGRPFCAGGHMNYHLTRCRGMR